MTVYQNRYLVVIGGETDDIKNDEAIKDVVKKEDREQISGSDKQQEEDANKPLNDVWLYDIYLEIWSEVTASIKVQTSFNSKKMRKIFEPRMAHSASMIGNYIVIFGGYNSQTN